MEKLQPTYRQEMTVHDGGVAGALSLGKQMGLVGFFKRGRLASWRRGVIIGAGRKWLPPYGHRLTYVSEICGQLGCDRER